MNAPSFDWKKTGKFEFLSSARFESLGVEQGFIGKTADFSSSGRARFLESFRQDFKVHELCLLEQVHGSKIVTVGESDLCADGIFIPRAEPSRNERSAFGIVVADCMAILLAAPHGVCLVHAGWRGLAGKIHLKALEKLAGSAARSQFHVLIWPCAGWENYEVGPEVIAALGEGAACVPGNGDRSFLGLRETACKDFLQFLDRDQIQISPQCTVTDSSFHSYRREGSNAGRNLAFVIL